MAGRPRRSIHIPISRRRPVTRENHLPAPSLLLPVRHAAQVAASLGRSEKLVRRSIALDEACVATAPRTIVLKRLKRQPK